ncbi:Sorting nexin, cytoplasm-to-vacuole targeting pathway/endosomal sorting [Polyrhizophydium stewartii]|uniref:Sorting nexin, cytoplasm-to-vacuole targeting pathway/endosomal sorting n=1 Tax=Polyrhizophydium stewartii TaxID=2732419 RepID=A0ABR4N8W1_9FUNG
MLAADPDCAAPPLEPAADDADRTVRADYVDILRHLLNKMRAGGDAAALRALLQTLSETTAARQRVVLDAQESLAALTRQLEAAREALAARERDLAARNHAETMLALDRTKYATARAASDLLAQNEAAAARLRRLEAELADIDRETDEFEQAPLGAEAVRINMYKELGVMLVKDDNGACTKAIAMSKQRNDVQTIDIVDGMSQYYYANLIWEICGLDMDPLSQAAYNASGVSARDSDDSGGPAAATAASLGDLAGTQSLAAAAAAAAGTGPAAIGSEPERDPNVTSAVFSLGSYPDADQPQHRPKQKTSFCCDIDKVLSSAPLQLFLPQLQTESDLREQTRPAITITDALKAHDMSGSSYIAYVIHTEITAFGVELEAKHRYSEFESLRKLLVRAYPTCVVPPIPEKHTVAEYAAKPGKAKEDPRIILLRKRMLQTFLNRVAAHPVLMGAHVFHLFIKGDAPWSEILASSGLAHLLKNKDGGMMKVNEKTSLKKPDAHFIAAEDYTARFLSQVLYIERIHKRIMSHYADTAATLADLGGFYNGWSLTEGSLSEAIEQTGQAVDSCVTATNTLHTHLEDRFGEALHEYAQFSKAIEKLLRWRHKKHVEFESISETLILKQSQLLKLEQAEHEAQRLSAVLSAEGVSGTSSQYAYSHGGAGSMSAASAGGAGSASAAGGLTSGPSPTAAMGIGASGAPLSATTAGSTSPTAGTSAGGAAASSAAAGGAAPAAPVVTYGGSIGTSIPPGPPIPQSRPHGLFATLNSLMDNDPDVTRRNNISKTRDMIVTLEDQRETTRHELLAANAEIQQDLDRFQRQKIGDLRDMLMAYALAQKEYHRKALAAWQEAKGVVERIQ